MMQLRQLVEASGVVVQQVLQGDLLVAVRGVQSDSRRVTVGDVFVAMSGARMRGVDFVADAIGRGAAAVITDVTCDPASLAAWRVPVLLVADARRAMGLLAAASRGHPSRSIEVIGVTGTNGKTTTTVLTAQLLQAAGHRAAAIGTTGIWTAEGTRPSQLTTPEAAELQALLAQLADEGFTHVALEVSSHALDQQRVAGVQFAAIAWTNLSRDHLDYHGDMSAYAAAKARLFHDYGVPSARAFVNADDAYAAAIAVAGFAEGWTMRDAASAPAAAPHVVRDLTISADGLRMTLATAERQPLAVEAPLLGRHNAENLTAALLICRALGVPDPVLVAACRHLRAPRGRLEPVANRLGALVVVDYAHTPDALQQVLSALRPLVAADGRLLTVFGCGGDRDPGKRGEMGRVAGRLADIVLATSDNPRSEQPQLILDAIAEGLQAVGARHVTRLVPSQWPRAGGAAYATEVDRGEAIRRAIGLLRKGDVLCIAGKGHETTQTIGDAVRPFDDRAVAQRWLDAVPPVDRALPPLAGGVSLDAPLALQLCGGRAFGAVAAGQWSRGLTTDSRHVPPGSLFVALPGERFDGGLFVADALRQGARGVICQSGRAAAALQAAGATAAWVVEVDDPLQALADVMRWHRGRFDLPVVGITGSNGKTTTKELTALALSPLGEVLATTANHNNRIGVPQTLARLAPQHRAAVVEMGMSVPGEIAELARMGQPDVAVITSIGEAHLLGMGSLAGIADEKGDIVRALGDRGVAVLPADEPLLVELASELRCRVVWFGGSGDVRRVGEVRSGGLDGDAPWQQFEAQVGAERVTVHIPSLGVHVAHNALAALAVAWVLGVAPQAAADALSRYQPVGQRMLPSRVRGQTCNWLLLEDCYNANPRSTETALDTLATLPGPRAAVLGSMLELGATERQLHQRVGAHAARVGIDVLVAVGPFAADYAAGAASAGQTRVRVCDNHAEAAAALIDAMPQGTVLVKGSRGARMEHVVAALRQHTGQAIASGGC